MRDTLISILNIDNAESAFKSTFQIFRNIYKEEDLEFVNTNKSVFLFRGGEDVHPSLYGETRVAESGASFIPSERDVFESIVFKFALKMKIPMIGICRGSQFLCALSGGKLVQHVNGHTCGSHSIITVKGEEYNATSTHHQMMYPWGTKHKLIAWSAPKLGKTYRMSPKETLRDLIAEPEIVFFEKSKALAIQGHPEYLSQNDPYTKYCNTLAKELCCEV